LVRSTIQAWLNVLTATSSVARAEHVPGDKHALQNPDSAPLHHAFVTGGHIARLWLGGSGLAVDESSPRRYQPGTARP
jgi:hypothetical protein